MPQFLRFCPNITINCAIFQFSLLFQFSFYTINPIAYCIEKFAIWAEILCYRSIDDSLELNMHYILGTFFMK